MKFWPVLLLVILTACQVNTKPDLALLYQPQNSQNQTPLILIHGSLGSKLRLIESGKEVWPGKLNDLIFSNYKVLANHIKPDTLSVDYEKIESYAIFDSYSGLSIYDDIIKTLTTYGGYQLNKPQQAVGSQRQLYVFHYDWRQDNVHNAQKLAAFIDQVLKKHPNQQQVDVVAHSMGGILLRYYQRFGAKDVLPLLQADSSAAIQTDSQANKIRHAIFLGTPQLGSVKPVLRLMSGFDFNLRNIPVEVQITMPSVYQLLPHPQSHWLADYAGNSIQFDLYDPNNWKQHEWSIYNTDVITRIHKNHDPQSDGETELQTLQAFFNHQLRRAKALWLALSPKYEVDHEGFIIMGGSCKQTLNRLILEQDHDHVVFHDKINHAVGDKDIQRNILYEPGDGQVTKSSLLGQIRISDQQTLDTIKVRYPVFVCEDHLKLTENITFQDNLLHILLN
ncbi:hypothetical protein OS175_07895 [Marinicella sp. S1101]|uniref:lipase/acyltransferase domain-containing protein n=1 Tax=Marinicella marina TaxID=2996016 RepID=UPI002260F50E|nr:hypothetical protein [Marinicella marina]MCX7553796.1 hypothetical protein [Marinicella marina]MDJ1140872.1 hypothetical protein [Marinicella marina]